MKRFFAILAMLCLLLCGCNRLVSLPKEDADLQPTYIKACDLLKEGNLEEAYPLFLSLGDYKDSALHASKFAYLPTEILAENDGLGEGMALYKTTYSYDEQGHLLQGEGTYIKGDGPGYKESHIYNKEGLLLETKTLSEAGDSTITYTYNDQGQCIQETGFTLGANVGGITRFSYDAAGRCVCAENRSYIGTDPAQYEVDAPYHTLRKTYSYNDQGLCTKAEESLGESGSITYTVEYNEWNLPAHFIHADGQGFRSETVFTYDEKGRCTKVDTDYDVTEFTYGDGALPLSAIRTQEGGKPCKITYTYQLFYLNEAPKIPFFLEEYLSGLEV